MSISVIENAWKTNAAAANSYNAQLGRPRRRTRRAVAVYSFVDLDANTGEQIQSVRTHPWIPKDTPVRGFVYDVRTGRLREVSAIGSMAA